MYLLKIKAKMMKYKTNKTKPLMKFWFKGDSTKRMNKD